MNTDFKIQLETKNDYNATERLTFEAFETMKLQNRELTNEHFFIHLLRQDQTFIPKLDFVAKEYEQIIGNIMYNSSPITTENTVLKKVITLAVLSVLPKRHNQGIGSTLIQFSIKKAKQLGYKAILVCGHPEYYKKFGFVPARNFGLKWIDDSTPDFFLALEIEAGYLGHKGGFWTLCDSINMLNNENTFNKYQLDFNK